MRTPTSAIPGATHEDVIAAEFALVLEHYQSRAERMIEQWPDMQLYREASEEMERLRALSARLPHLSVQWIGLLIAHSELVHSLWSRGASSCGPDLGECPARHADCLSELRMQLQSRRFRLPGTRVHA